MPFDTTDIRPHARLIEADCASLAETAYADLKGFFSTVGHDPSGQQWAAVSDLLNHLQLAATGTLPIALHVSAIPAGTGKSQSIAAFARALMANPDHVGTGMLILVTRIAEAEDMAMELRQYEVAPIHWTGNGVS